MTLSNFTITSYYSFLSELLISDIIIYYFFIAISINLIEQILNAKIDTLGFNLNTKILLSLVLINLFTLTGILVAFIIKLLQWGQVLDIHYKISFFENLIYSSAILIPSLYYFYKLYKEVFVVYSKRSITKVANRQLERMPEPRARKDIDTGVIDTHAKKKTIENNYIYLTFVVKVLVSIFLITALFSKGIIMGIISLPMVLFYIIPPWERIKEQFQAMGRDEDGAYVIRR